MDRHAATRRLKHLAASAGIRMPRMHPHMLRHTFVTTMQVSDVAFDASFDMFCDRCAITDWVFATCSVFAPLSARHAVT
jgi:site-specific recombinase XerC